MAIVNRLDTRGNSGYTGSISNAGETRFIYTLIDPTNGKPPVHDNITGFYDVNGGPIIIATGAGAGAIDWVGMNVILEYGNPINKICDVQKFAKQWYDLSQYDLNNLSDVPNFKERL